MEIMIDGMTPKNAVNEVKIVLDGSTYTITETHERTLKIRKTSFSNDEQLIIWPGNTNTIDLL